MGVCRCVVLCMLSIKEIVLCIHFFFIVYRCRHRQHRIVLVYLDFSNMKMYRNREPPTQLHDKACKMVRQALRIRNTNSNVSSHSSQMKIDSLFHYVVRFIFILYVPMNLYLFMQSNRFHTARNGLRCLFVFNKFFIP